MSKRALISVSDKTGIIDFAQGLQDLGYKIISTGGTAQTLSRAGVEVTAVSEVTGFPEILGGRVKTLHPKIQGGILARQTAEHQKQIADLGIEPLDLVVVNLYPFRETIAQADVTLEEAIENIDIGGPTMVRAAAKNYERVTVIVNPLHYEIILQQLRQEGEISLATRKKLALEAFTHTASYDVAISQYLSKVFAEADFPRYCFWEGEKIQDLRYGENPHQKAAFYRFRDERQGTLTGAKKLQGKELSYNNLVDIEAAWSIVTEFSAPAVTIIKHTNPCGASVGKDIHEAYLKAYESDPLSAFGGIVALNREVDYKTAAEIKKIFLEVIIAPSFSEEARTILAIKKNLRLIEMGEQITEDQDYWLEPVSGGFLLQERDQAKITATDLKVVTKKKPTAEQIAELLYAWKIVKHVKSNAIVLTKNKQILGVGAGQMNRVGAAKIALEQAKEQVRGAVLASDAFLPFSDTVEVAAQAGISAIIQPGGSIRDEDVITKADEYGIVMVFTGMRHFKH
ncbi:MAG TPA: bifunctional phosphoribosylaminoimidazolecarboxamide formyltransferase/IMP cyclohydrolase [Clostridia bacterium]|nr:bifunctional phosphoribosylaminoimidazolecarboxamide formyltransferase/IMP cyclohydrolase [Clostridia bacterium]HHY05656.1 bifunctional phosphoribosylaminoimidazolecarboxamide formyltransferase/IMP cyclohydrolase [Clostridia bacterium]